MPLSPDCSRTNLCPTTDKRALCPALSPSPSVIPEGWQPLAMVRVGSAERLLLKRESAIGFQKGMAVPYPFQLDGNPAFAATIDGVLIVVTDTGIMKMLDIDDLHAIHEHPDFSSMPPMLRAEDAGRVYSTPAPVEVSLLAGQGSVKSTERDKMARSSRQAYADIREEAEAQGVMLHPLVARIRLLGADGRQLFTTEPVVLCHPAGEEFDGRFEFEFDSSSGFAVAAEVSAPAWRPVLEMPSLLLKALPEGAVVEVLASEPMERFDLKATPSVSPRRRATDPLATAVMRKAVRTPRTVVSHAGEPMFSAWSSRKPSTSQPIVLSLQGAKPEVVSGLFPIGWAAAAATSFSAVVWASPEARRPDPPAADSYAIETADSAWHGITAVEFADGSRQVTVAEGITGAPTSFSPLMCYPSADAVSLTIIVSSGGSVMSGRFPLVSDTKCAKAMYAAPSLSPVSLSNREPSFVAPPTLKGGRSFPKSIAVAPTASPLEPFALLEPGGTINGILPAPSGQSAWDFGRSRFYVFASSGIYMLNVDSSKRRASLGLIDTRVVPSAHAACRVDGAIAAIASGDIVLMSGNRLNRIGREPQARALAWNHADHELWCIKSDGVAVICLDCDCLKYEMPAVYEPAPVQATHDTTYLAVSGGGVITPGHTRYSNAVPIAVTKPMALGKGKKRLVVDAPGTYESLSIKVTRTNGLTQAPSPDVRIDLKGQVSAPVCIRLALPPTSRSVNIEIEGVAAIGTRIQSIRMIDDSFSTSSKAAKPIR